jgi:hypothetical protein
METVFVLFLDNHFEGVFTTHRKAVQAVLMNAVPKNWKMTDYSFQFGTEFFTYEDDQYNEMNYELMEVTPDERA